MGTSTGSVAGLRVPDERAVVFAKRATEQMVSKVVPTVLPGSTGTRFVSSVIVRNNIFRVWLHLLALSRQIFLHLFQRGIQTTGYSNATGEQNNKNILSGSTWLVFRSIETIT